MAKKASAKRSAAASKPKVRTRRSAGSRTASAGTGRVHLYVGISLDGYLADPDGGVSWLDHYDDSLTGFGAFIKTIGSAIMGRTTYDHAISKLGHSGRFETPTYVVTHRPLAAASSTLIPYNGDLRALVQQIRGSHKGDIWLMGGGDLTKSFIAADLIDIWSIGLVPTVLGAGLPMFPPAVFAERRLRLVQNHASPSGAIALRYERH
jgi:dihydrofolate reductase